MTRFACIVAALALSTAVLAAPAQQKSFDQPSSSRLWSLCDDADTHLLKPFENGVAISPKQPKVGQDLDVLIKGILESDVTGGRVDLDLKLMSFIKLQKDLDLCSTLNSDIMAGGTTCPMQAGEVTIHARAHIPQDVPRVSVAGNIRILNQNEEVVTCVRLDLKLH